MVTGGKVPGRLSGTGGGGGGAIAGESGFSGELAGWAVAACVVAGTWLAAGPLETGSGSSSGYSEKMEVRSLSSCAISAPGKMARDQDSRKRRPERRAIGPYGFID
ncbi:MAG: hypothetical protein LBU69_06865 [Deltaproteobacteria bacterium]|nr:hypothetical protein [Deltaproteobacteria bacterium]